MKKTVSIMTEYPEKSLMRKSISCSLFTFVLLPYLLSLFKSWAGRDIYLSYDKMVWVDIAYHVLNFTVAALLFFGYLRDAFLNVRIHTKLVMKTATLGALLMLAVAACLFVIGVCLRNTVVAFGALPLAEIEMFGVAGAMAATKPIPGTIVLALMAPFTICCLFYATVFASVSSSYPRLAYVVLAIVLAVPKAIYAMTFWIWTEELILYLIQLPIHMIGCRIYQKTDTIWTPVFALMLVNLLFSMLYFL